MNQSWSANASTASALDVWSYNHTLETGRAPLTPGQRELVHAYARKTRAEYLTNQQRHRRASLAHGVPGLAGFGLSTHRTRTVSEDEAVIVTLAREGTELKRQIAELERERAQADALMTRANLPERYEAVGMDGAGDLTFIERITFACDVCTRARQQHPKPDPAPSPAPGWNKCGPAPVETAPPLPAPEVTAASHDGDPSRDRNQLLSYLTTIGWKVQPNAAFQPGTVLTSANQLGELTDDPSGWKFSVRQTDAAQPYTFHTIVTANTPQEIILTLVNPPPPPTPRIVGLRHRTP